jgi:hypothetical protein
MSSIDKQLEVAEINKKINRWLPRLNDPSSDVREKAAEALSQLALKHKDLRDNLLPTLMRAAANEESWMVVCNGTLYYLSDIPKKDPRWVTPFLTLYISLIKEREYVIRENASRYVWGLIEDGLLTKDHPDLEKVVSLARELLEKGGSGGERLSFFNIVDWYEE